MGCGCAGIWPTLITYSIGMGDTIVMVSKSSILTKVSILSILAKSIGNSIPLGPVMFLAKRLLSKAGEGR